jgi:hypothetical protein
MTIVAQQNSDRRNNAFELDLHGCSMEEGRIVAGARVRECFRYGIEELRIIYGSADHAEGTLRQAVQKAIREASNCVAACSFRGPYGMLAAEEQSTEVRVKLASNPRPKRTTGRWYSPPSRHGTTPSAIDTSRIIRCVPAIESNDPPA